SRLRLSAGSYAACPAVAARVEPWAPRQRRVAAGHTPASRPPGARAGSHRHGGFPRSTRGVAKTYLADHNGSKAGACELSSVRRPLTSTVVHVRSPQASRQVPLSSPDACALL